ncbi:hypothetical protein ACS0TY_018557 [Phlomoides rotata]
MSGEEEENSAELKIPDEFLKAKCLMNCEVALILEHKYEQLQQMADDPMNQMSQVFEKSLQYVKRFSRYKNPDAVRQVREILSRYKLAEFEFSGDDDLPKRDDIGERRRKHELRVLAGAGIQFDDYVDDETVNFSNDGGSDVDEKNDSDSDLEYYKQVEQQHAAKLAAKSNKYSRTPEVPLLPETVDGKRYITSQILKNRGLTRSRKKETKNPRKNYKMKHKKAEMRRKGQVRDIRKPTGSYGGEATVAVKKLFVLPVLYQAL